MTDCVVRNCDFEFHGGNEESEETPVFVPPVDILESESRITLIADMPGVDKESLQVIVEGNHLVLRGERPAAPPPGHSLIGREYAAGIYQRTLTLGDAIDRDNIRASVKDGTLHLELPRVKHAHPRKIEVVSG